jgi:glycerol uptake facilitator-like aquaporin
MIPYLFEFVGVIIFVLVILIVGQPMAIGVVLVAVIYIAANVSGAHFNPAVSVMMYFNDRLSSKDLIGYITAQILGALVALWIYKTYIQNKQF